MTLDPTAAETEFEIGWLEKIPKEKFTEQNRREKIQRKIEREREDMLETCLEG